MEDYAKLRNLLGYFVGKTLDMKVDALKTVSGLSKGDAGSSALAAIGKMTEVGAGNVIDAVTRGGGSGGGNLSGGNLSGAYRYHGYSDIGVGVGDGKGGNAVRRWNADGTYNDTPCDSHGNPTGPPVTHGTPDSGGGSTSGGSTSGGSTSGGSTGGGSTGGGSTGGGSTGGGSTGGGSTGGGSTN